MTDTQEQFNGIMHSLKEAHHWIDDAEHYRGNTSADMFLATGKAHLQDAMERLGVLGREILHKPTPVEVQQTWDFHRFEGVPQ